ncbi:MAG: tRNA pseudouridine(55) synthase TruB [Candidatus Nanopelagicales bacterium]
MPGPSGVLVVDKPAGLTSHSAVARVRRALGVRRVGHAGTLDPDATGVLVLGIGPATRLLGYLSGDDKDYSSRIVLGLATTTDDASGEVLSESDASGLTREALERALEGLRGDIMQRPSAVSAVKVDGRRAYDRVRAGEDVELPPRPVTIRALTLVGMDREDSVAVIDIAVTCSAGTYIRALARDLGDALGVGGHVRTLRRTRSGAFSLADAVPLDAVEDGGVLLESGDAARRSMPHVEIDREQADLARHGVQIEWPEAAPASGVVAFLHDDALVGLAERSGARAMWRTVFS